MRRLVFLLVILLAVITVPSSFFTAQLPEMPFTAPNPELAHNPFSFIAYGDIQDSYRGAHREVVAHMLEEPAVLVINTGDISPNNGESYDRYFLPDITKLAHRIPFFPAVGNHDVEWYSPQSRRSFLSFFRRSYDYLGKNPINQHLRERHQEKLWYAFTYEGALFVALDSNFFIDEGRYRATHSQEQYRHHAEDQLKWVAKTLREAHQNPTIKTKFIYFHHSPIISSEEGSLFGFGGHPGHSNMLLNLRMPEAANADAAYLLDLFRLYKVTAVFTGHEHYYERWREWIRDGKGDPLHVINWVVTGMGGVKPRGEPLSDSEEIQQVVREEFGSYLDRVRYLNPGWTANLEHAYPNSEAADSEFSGYVLVHVNGSDIRFETKDANGRVRDSGTFSVPYYPIFEIP